MRAYVTLLSTMSYLPGVLVLHESLKQVDSSYPLWVGISAGIPLHVDADLQKKGLQVVRLPASIKIPVSLSKASGHWRNTFDKLHLFGLVSFNKLVYLDSDMILLANIDALFEKPHMSAVAAGRLIYPDWKRLNSGLMVIEPEHGLPEKIAAMLEPAIRQASAAEIDRLGDQDLINAYYSEWPDAGHLHLDQGYNLFCTHLDDYIGKHGYQLPASNVNASKLIRVVHFVGADKPWMKWAGLKHFLATCRKRAATQWQRKLFWMYSQLLKKI
ncbi:MAG: hypothetical protein JWR60_800 [Polaromonas sp.]|nr:hypothetical protein [Polaromonas sp.]